MKTAKILTLLFLLITNLACQKEIIDPDPPIDSELKAVNGKGNIWGNNCAQPIDCLTIEEHPPIADLRKSYPYLTTTVFKGAIWRLGTNPTPGTYTITKSTNGTDWQTVTTISNNRVTFKHLIVFRNELWLAGEVAPFGDSGPNLLRSSDGINWQPVRNIPTENIENIVAFKNRLYVVNRSRMYYSIYGNAWGRIDFPPNQQRQVLAGLKMVVFKDHVYAFTNTAIGFRTYPIEIWKSSDGIIWRRITPRWPYMYNKFGFSVTSFKGKLWAIGGGIRYNYPRAVVYYNDIWYSDDAVNWTKFTGQNPLERVLDHSATVFKDKLWLFGGWGATKKMPVNPTYEITF